eukprot:TRINITY_DN525_c0_g2_i1.p1 TRINITY_DN525_c0_g2~~TRINITY_DN525_c0_g2_i1.p1  ORF type:complete len:1302 (+),score=332.24 TRINITY_DN525_c0_g2_i1:53-3907(+)
MSAPPSVVVLSGGVGALLAIAFALLFSWPVLVAFVLGLLLALVALLGGFYQALRLAPSLARARTDAWLESEVQSSPQHEASALVLQVPAVESTIKLLVNPQNKDRVTMWYTGRVRGNMFMFEETRPQHSQTEVRKSVIRLDGASVALVKTKTGALFKDRNYLELHHPSRALLGNTRTLCLFFQTRRQIEEWYFALSAGTQQSGRSVVQLNPIFKSLAQQLYPGVGAAQVAATWFNGLASRIFYHYHDDPKLVEKLRKLIQKKFDKLNKPDIITSLNVTQVTLNQNFPLIDAVRLLQVTESGAVKVQCNAKYAGGFSMTVKLIVRTPEFLGFKSRLVPATLSVLVRSIEGKLIAHLAAPPAGRLWFGFEGEPKVDMKITTDLDFGDSTLSSLMSSNFPQLSKIIRALLFQEVVEKVVLPNMEDIELPVIGSKKEPSRAPINVKWASADLRAEDLKANIFTHTDMGVADGGSARSVLSADAIEATFTDLSATPPPLPQRPAAAASASTTVSPVSTHQYPPVSPSSFPPVPSTPPTTRSPAPSPQPGEKATKPSTSITTVSAASTKEKIAKQRTKDTKNDGKEVDDGKRVVGDTRLHHTSTIKTAAKAVSGRFSRLFKKTPEEKEEAEKKKNKKKQPAELRALAHSPLEESDGAEDFINSTAPARPVSNVSSSFKANPMAHTPVGLQKRPRGPLSTSPPTDAPLSASPPKPAVTYSGPEDDDVDPLTRMLEAEEEERGEPLSPRALGNSPPRQSIRSAPSTPAAPNPANATTPAAVSPLPRGKVRSSSTSAVVSQREVVAAAESVSASLSSQKEKKRASAQEERAAFKSSVLHAQGASQVANTPPPSPASPPTSPFSTHLKAKKITVRDQPPTFPPVPTQLVSTTANSSSKFASGDSVSVSDISSYSEVADITDPLLHISSSSQLEEKVVAPEKETEMHTEAETEVEMKKENEAEEDVFEEEDKETEENRAAEVRPSTTEVVPPLPPREHRPPPVPARNSVDPAPPPRPTTPPSSLTAPPLPPKDAPTQSPPLPPRTSVAPDSDLPPLSRPRDIFASPLGSQRHLEKKKEKAISASFEAANPSIHAPSVSSFADASDSDSELLPSPPNLHSPLSQSLGAPAPVDDMDAIFSITSETFPTVPTTTPTPSPAPSATSSAPLPLLHVPVPTPTPKFAPTTPAVDIFDDYTPTIAQSAPAESSPFEGFDEADAALTTQSSQLPEYFLDKSSKSSSGSRRRDKAKSGLFSFGNSLTSFVDETTGGGLSKLEKSMSDIFGKKDREDKSRKDSY